MKRTSQGPRSAAVRRRPRYFRPRLESYEERLPLGESMLSLMLGTSLAGVALVTFTANAASAPAQPDAPAPATGADADMANLDRWVSAPMLDSLVDCPGRFPSAKQPGTWFGSAVLVVRIERRGRRRRGAGRRGLALAGR
jgi:hypothetical protein